MIGNTISLYKQAYAGLSRNSWCLAVVLFINRSGTMVLPFMLPYMIDGLHFDAGVAGLIMAIFGVGAVLGAYIGGQLADKFGFYPIQFITLILNGFIFIGMGYMRTPVSLGITVFLLSLAGEAFRPANSAAIAHYSSPENRTRSYAIHRLAVNLGWGIGPAIGGILADINYHLLFWVDGITCIAAAIVMRYLLPVVKSGKLHSEKNKSVTNAKIQSAYKDKFYLFFIFLSISYAFCFFQMNSTVPVFYIKELGMTKTQSGIVMSLNGIIIALFELILVYKLEGKKNHITYMGIGILLTGISFLFFNIFPYSILLAIAAVIVITTGEMISMPFMNSYWISLSNEQNRGQYAALYTMSYSFAQIFSPLVGTQLMKNFGFTFLWFVIAATCLVTFFGTRLLLQIDRR
ncbi:MAG: MFS transporter [Sphingobacteriales bacterium]|nr:MAG: MFS transporter [Sphingobacteriales bacterium]